MARCSKLVSVIRQTDIRNPSHDALRRTCLILALLAKDVQPHDNHEKTSDKCKLRTNITDPLLFKSVKVTKCMERLTNCSRLKESKETWKLNGIWGPELDPGTTTKKGTLVENLGKSD